MHPRASEKVLQTPYQKDVELDLAPLTPEAMQTTIDEIGFGPYQVVALVCCGGIMFAEGSEVLIMGSITRLLANEWGLSHFVRGLMTAVVFVGFAIGNLISGYVGDRFGRRPGILLSYVMIGVAGMLTSISGNPAAMMIIRVFVGIGCGIGFPSVYSLIPEVCPTRLRGVTSALMIGFMPMGEFFAAFGVFMIDPNLAGGVGWLGLLSWRSLVQFSALPAFFFLAVSLLLLNESPHFLLANGRTDELNRMMSSLAWMNGVPAAAKPSLRVAVGSGGSGGSSQGVSAAGRAADAAKENYSWTDAAKHTFDNRYLATTLVLFLAHFTKDFSVFGLNYVFPQYFQESAGALTVGVEMMTISALTLPGVSLAVLITYTQFIGSIPSITLAASLEMIMAIGLLEAIHLWFCAYLLKFLAMCYFIVTVVYTAEVYPTKFRNTAVGICTSVGRLGSISAPIFFEMMNQVTGSFDAFWYCLIALTGCVVLASQSFLTIETKGLALADDDSRAIAAKNRDGRTKSYASTV